MKGRVVQVIVQIFTMWYIPDAELPHGVMTKVAFGEHENFASRPENFSRRSVLTFRENSACLSQVRQNCRINGVQQK